MAGHPWSHRFLECFNGPLDFVKIIAASLCLSLLGPCLAHAQGGEVPRWVDSDPFVGEGTDPLAIDRGGAVEAVRPTRPEEQAFRPVPVRQGEALSAIPGVREIHHEASITLHEGFAEVAVELRFASTARHLAELAYRLATPSGVAIVSLEVCHSDGCREGVLGRDGPEAYDAAVRAAPALARPRPVAHAAPVADERGAAILLRAAPVGQVRGPRGERFGGGELTLRLRYVVPFDFAGGRARLLFPPRGRDERAARARLGVRSNHFSAGAIDGLDAVERAVEREPWESAEVTARLRPGGRVRALFDLPCSEGRCASLFVAAGPAAIPARDVFLLVDVSPSTAAQARGRQPAALGAILSTLPPASRVRIVLFAARAEPLVERPTAPTEVPLSVVARALDRDLGSATRFEAAWDAIAADVGAARGRPLVWIVGDGGLTEGEESERALDAARAGRAEIISLNLADRPTTPALRRALERVGGRGVDAGPEAARAAEGHGLDALEERFSTLLSPEVERALTFTHGNERVALGALRAGESRRWAGPSRGRARGLTPRALDEPMAAALAELVERELESSRGPRAASALGLPERSEASCGFRLGPSRADAPTPVHARLALVAPRPCREESPPASEPAEAPATRAELPASSLLGMLRRRIIPPARDCFRRDRAGRTDYQTRAVFEFELSDREVISARVEGEIDGALRRCLVEAIDRLDVPAFDGVARVRYPLYTEAVPTPPTVELREDVAELVDRVTESE